jgi:hypothetical protein
VLTSFTDTGFSHNLYLSLPLLINAFFCTACIACSGKTTLLSVLAHGQAVETVPTIGLNVKVFKKGKVNMKCWDVSLGCVVCVSLCCYIVANNAGMIHLPEM